MQGVVGTVDTVDANEIQWILSSFKNYVICHCS